MYILKKTWDFQGNRELVHWLTSGLQKARITPDTGLECFSGYMIDSPLVWADRVQAIRGPWEQHLGNVNVT